jgi:hypothetical protein
VPLRDTEPSNPKLSRGSERAGGRRRPPPVGPSGPTRDHPAGVAELGVGPRDHGHGRAPALWSVARWPRRSASCHRGERCRRRSPRGPRAADSARGATTCSSGRNRWASPARRQRWRPEDHRWHHCDGGVTSARGANSGSAEALAPAVAVICGGGPITRVKVARARRRPRRPGRRRPRRRGRLGSAGLGKEPRP